MVIVAGLILWFLGVNVLLMFYVKSKLVNYFKRNVDLYLDFYSKGYLEKLPSHIKVTKSTVKDKNYRFYGVLGNKYVFVNVNRIRNELLKFSLLLFLWEFLLTALILFVVYAGLKRLFRRQRCTDQFLRFILVAISHKLGNFLAAQRVNLELAEMDDKSKNRLSFALSEMEKDFKVISSTIKSITADKVKLSYVDVVEEFREILKSHIASDKRVKVDISIDKYFININATDLRIVLSEILTNAFKYSLSWISVSLEQYGKGVKLVMANDVKTVSKGSGIGLSIVDFLCRKNGWVFAKSVDNNTFEVVFVVNPSKAIA